MEGERVGTDGASFEDARGEQIARAVAFAGAALATQDTESSLLDQMGHMFLVAGALISWAATVETVVAAILRVAFAAGRDWTLLDQIWDEFGDGVALLVESSVWVDGDGPEAADEGVHRNFDERGPARLISATDELVTARTTLHRLLGMGDRPPGKWGSMGH